MGPSYVVYMYLLGRGLHIPILALSEGSIPGGDTHPPPPPPPDPQVRASISRILRFAVKQREDVEKVEVGGPTRMLLSFYYWKLGKVVIKDGWAYPTSRVLPRTYLPGHGDN